MSTETDREMQALDAFSERTRRWFESSFEAPTPAQSAGWPKIASGANTLICAPTGSGKTLSAFLWGIDTLARRPEELGTGTKIVYVSPLKALSYDVEQVADLGAFVAVAVRHRGTPAGTTHQVERREAHLWTFAGGRAVSLREYPTLDAALEAAADPGAD